MKFISDKKIMHRDVTLNNIFIDDDNTLKLGNFGNAVKVSNKNEFRYTITENTNYLSPQMLSTKGYLVTESDPWALGVVLFALLVGKLPFDH